MKSVEEGLTEIGATVRDRFEAEKRVLAFEQYLDLLREHPVRHTRDAARYLLDCFDAYGNYPIEKPWGRIRRFRLFDQDFDGTGAGKRDALVGQEAVQEAFYRTLQNFVREGRANRLFLLHGPNGSAKSTFAAAIMRGLENYSHSDDGASYRFSWIFPRGRDGKSIGFSAAPGAIPGKSYAHLPDAQIDAKLTSELREHPLFLLPIAERRRLLTDIGVVDPPHNLWHGELGHKNQQIYDALLTAYRGDLRTVLNHVRVERYYVSRRYRLGAVTIGPQMQVDASERQITADRSLSSLPASLSALTLFEAYGDLVDASGGVVEYSDLLKRPLEAWKYLLLAIEAGEVALTFSNVPVNAILLASSNEVHLAAFKEHHEYNSFRGRLQLIRVPYLLDYRQEQGIYDSQIAPQVRRHVAPHATFIAALWSVLTRLRRPQADRLPAEVAKIATDLSPLEKAELYSSGTVPRRLSTEEGRVLEAHVKDLWNEWDSVTDYEGLTGASPREIRTLLLDAANDDRYECLSPRAVLDRIDAFIHRMDYEFLKQSPDRGYHDARGFWKQVRLRWLDLVEGELRAATGLIDEIQHTDLFRQYVANVSTWTKKEKVYDSVTGKYRDPDDELMRKVEERLDVGKSEAGEFRHNLIRKIAGHALQNAGKPVDYAALFPRYIDKIREAYYAEHRKRVGTIARDVLALLDAAVVPDDGKTEPPAKDLDSARRAAAEKALAYMIEHYGYERVSVREAIDELLKERYTA
jgi:serine protein kinase